MKEEIAQYNMRLNLTNPVHLMIHQKMRDLNTDIHKSRNQFMIESVYRNIQGYSDARLTNEGAAEKEADIGYATREDLRELENRLRQEFLQTIISTMSQGSNSSISELTNTLKELLSSNVTIQASEQETEEEPAVDMALQDVANDFF